MRRPRRQARAQSSRAVRARAPPFGRGVRIIWPRRLGKRRAALLEGRATIDNCPWHSRRGVSTRTQTKQCDGAGRTSATGTDTGSSSAALSVSAGDTSPEHRSPGADCDGIPHCGGLRPRTRRDEVRPGGRELRGCPSLGEGGPLSALNRRPASGFRPVMQERVGGRAACSDLGNATHGAGRRASPL